MNTGSRIKTFIVTSVVAVGEGNKHREVKCDPREVIINQEETDWVNSPRLIEAGLGEAKRQLGWDFEQDTASIQISWKLKE